MLGDNQNTNDELPSAMSGRPEKALDTTSPQMDTAPHRKRGLISRGTANGKAILDWAEYQPDAVFIDTERDGVDRHRTQPGALKAYRSPAGIDEAHQIISANGHATVAQQPTAVASARQPLAAAQSPTDRTPFAFASLALLLGYAWLLAGVDKLLLGNFPTQLTQILAGSLHGGTIPGFFADFLRVVVLPNGALFGLMAEYAEILAGLGLIAASLAILFAPPLEQRVAPPVAQWVARTRRLAVALGVLAAIGTVLLGGIYYLLDGAPSQWFMPSAAVDGALDPGLQLALGSLVLLAIAALARGQLRSHQTQFATIPIRRDDGNGRQGTPIS